MISFDDVATEVFRILRSYDYTLQLFDDEGDRVYEPESARRFYAEEGLMVSLTDKGDNSELRMAFPKSVDITDIEGLNQTLRLTANKYNLMYKLREIGKDEITPADFATHASVTEGKKGQTMNVLEGMYGTTRSSYLKLENARMIVKHSKKIDENIIGSRGRHINAIFIENAQGERFLFPTRNLGPARAMTQHINQGGGWADAIGAQIGRMAQDYASLASASGFMAQNAGALAEGAMAVRESVRQRMTEMRKCFERLARAGGYMAEAARLEEQASTLNETEENDTLIHEMRDLLAVEGVELDESVLRVVAEAVKCCGNKEEPVEEGRRPAVDHDDEPCPTCHGTGEGKVGDDGASVCPTCNGAGIKYVSVMGHKVSTIAWQKFLQGRVDFFKQPSADMADPEGGGAGRPKFLNKDAELSFLLGQIVPEVKNNSLLSFLSWTSEQLQRRNEPKLQARLRLVAKEAIKAAGMSMDEGISPNHPAVREFAEWLGDFRTDKVLMEENPYDPDSYAYGRSSQARDDAAEAVANDFNPEDFLNSEDASMELGWGDDSLSDDERTVSKDYVVKLLAAYLRDKVEKEHDEVDVDMDSVAEDLYGDVEALLKSKNYNITEGDEAEGDDLGADDLSRDDVVIPTDQEDDLRREVEDPEATSDDIARMRTLAGLPQNR